MTDVALTDKNRTTVKLGPISTRILVVFGFVIASIAIAKVILPLSIWPDAWIIPFRTWLTNGFAVFATTIKPLTRTLSFIMAQPLYLAETLLFRGVRDWGIPPLPWAAVVAGVAILGHWIGGRALAMFTGLCAFYLVVFGLWSESMQTLSIVLVTVPLAAAIGLYLGIWAVGNPRIEKVLNTIFDVLQATPHMAYLGPVVVLFGFGQVPAMLATLLFAVPPMARCTILGLRTVPTDIVDAGKMSGCTKRQLLWKVKLPAAQRTLLLGLNQVVMQSLAIVVIASLVGASGLGQMLLFSLQQLQIGKAVEQGVAITLIALVLDRMTRAAMDRKPSRMMPGLTWPRRHPHFTLFLALTVLSFAVALVFPAIAILPKQWALSYGAPINDIVRWISKNLYAYIKPFRDTITIWVLLPIRDTYLWLPWSTVIGTLALVGWFLGGVRLALLPVALLGFLLVSGFWVPLMLTVYLVTSCTILCILIGVPIGVFASRNERAARIIMTICDTLQTFPSFIYLIPVIMLFQTSDLSNVIAMLFYATVPSIRYTYLGLKRVPETVIEAATACGTTKRQKLWKVELPIAFPEIVLGLNQTIMMALMMVAITAFIGSRDLGQEIYKALPGADTGRGLIAGFGIAFIGIIADRMLGTWAQARKKAMGQ